MKARQKELQNVFMRLWPMPTTSFEPLSREAESASLDDEDYEFTGKKLQAYMLHGVRYTVNTWKEMLIQVCGHILIEKRSTIEWLCANEKCSFSATPEEWRRELAPGMYLTTVLPPRLIFFMACLRSVISLHPNSFLNSVLIKRVKTRSKFKPKRKWQHLGR